MPSKKPATAAAYHREDLRADLLRKGHSHVAAYGHESLSMRALAQSVGVSPGAPYHYFPDRRSLLLAIAVDGFDQLLALGEDPDGQSLTPDRRLARIVETFLEFQQDHPRLLELMYESELTRPVIDAAIAAQQVRGFDLLTAAIVAARPLERVVAQRRAVVFWATTYGFASLIGKGLLQPFADGGAATVAKWREALITQTVADAIAPQSEPAGS